MGALDRDTAPTTLVEALHQFRGSDLHDLCETTELAVIDGGGFGWVEPPSRDMLERFWRGVLAAPGRSLLVGRLDGVIAGSAQLLRPPPNNEAQRFAAAIIMSFVAPWARGHGLARALLELAEKIARAEGFEVLTFDCRETQTAAMQLCLAMGFVHWGSNPVYAKVKGGLVTGHYYYKVLDPGTDGPSSSEPPQ